MYPFKLPHTIQSPFGEVLIFDSIEEENGVRKMNVFNHLKPGAGPPFHVHYKQEESLTVTKGILIYQIEGEEEKLLTEGENIVFKRGQMHRFRNGGNMDLECKGWIMPAHSFDYFLSGIYTSMHKAGTAKGDPFDSAYLITRYQSEYDLKDIPVFVKKVVFPLTVAIGKILGKYKHFKDAPEPIS